MFPTAKNCLKKFIHLLKKKEKKDSSFGILSRGEEKPEIDIAIL
jgi:predicted nucleotidyltransferase